MNKRDLANINSQIADLKSALTTISAELAKANGELAKERNANKILKEMCYRHEAQIARDKITTDEVERLRRKWHDRYFVEFHEIAMNIFELVGLTETPRNFFNASLLERMILDFAPVAVFEYAYLFVEGKRQVCPLVLPITPQGGFIDVYGGAPIVRAYAPSGNGETTRFPPLIPNKNCVVFTDFYEYSQTNANVSPTVRAVIDLTCDILADIEVAKIVNRNQIQMPFIFSSEDMEDKEVKKMANEVNTFVKGVKGHANAIMTPYASNLKILNTGVNYHGDDLEKAKRDAINSLYTFLGIGAIKNENKARKITAEFEKTADEYNINITTRLNYRNKSLNEAKKIFPQWFPENCYYRVNLAGYNTLNEDEGEADNATE